MDAIRDREEPGTSLESQAIAFVWTPGPALQAILQFMPIGDLPEGHRYFAYQAAVNKGGVPSEEVINGRRAKQGGEYRLQTDGDHPVPPLQENGSHDQLGYWRVANSQPTGIAAE